MNDADTRLPEKAAESRKKAAEPSVWSPFAGLRTEIDRLFDDFSLDWPPISFGRSRHEEDRFPFRGGLALRPAVDVKESEKSYTIVAELPGLDEDDIEVTVSDGGIAIRGEKTEEKEEKKEDYRLSERRYGSFERRFRLPDGVDAGKIEAHMKKGVLSVTLPKSAEAQKKVRKVAVKSK
jgi:HSP20 family protein